MCVCVGGGGLCGCVCDCVALRQAGNRSRMYPTVARTGFGNPMTSKRMQRVKKMDETLHTSVVARQQMHSIHRYFHDSGKYPHNTHTNIYDGAGENKQVCSSEYVFIGMQMHVAEYKEKAAAMRPLQRAHSSQNNKADDRPYS